MQQSNFQSFHINLDEFPGLFVVPAVTHAMQPNESEIAELQDEYRPLYVERYPMFNSPNLVNNCRMPDVLNDLRHRYAYSDEARSMLFLDRILQQGYMMGYLLNILSEWKLESQSDQAVRNLLCAAEKHSSLFCLRAACLLKSAQICQEHGFQNEAQKLSLAVLAATGQDRVGIEFNGERPGHRENPINWHPRTYIYIPEAYRTEATARYFNLRNAWNEQNTKNRQLASRGTITELLQMLIAKHGLSSQEERVMRVTNSAIGFAFDPTNENQISSSRFGGVPDVPPDWSWPGAQLEFLAQLNLEEIAPFDYDGVLPKRGLLSFFARNLAYGWENNNSDYYVMFYDGDFNLLQRAAVPTNFDVYEGERQQRESDLLVFGMMPISPYPFVTIASRIDSVGIDDDSAEDEFMKPIRELDEDLRSQSYFSFYGNQLLGRYEEGAVEAWSERNGTRYYSLQGDAKTAADRESEDWILLFQIDSISEIGMGFSDAGTLYFMIHRDDLATRRFDRIHLTMTCG